MSSPTLYQNIRGALQSRALTAVGFPPADQVAFEGVPFTSTTGRTYARMTIAPVMNRAFSVDAVRKRHDGLFQISLWAPARDGSDTVEGMADAVRDVFEPGTHLTQNGATVIVEYAERTTAIQEPDWIHIPVTVGWSCFSPHN